MGAKEDLRSWLDQLGLGDLADEAWQMYVEGAEIDYVYQEIRQSDTYKERFSGLISLREQGASAGMTEVQYLQEEQAMRDSLARAGLGDTSFSSNEYLGDVISKQVSVDEFQTRVRLAEAASSTLPPEVRGQLESRYGVGQNNLLAYYLDTDKVEQDLIRQQEASAIAAAYERFQAPGVRTGLFEDAARRGVEYGEAVAAFQGLGTLGAGMTDQERLEGAFGLNRDLQLERSGRGAAFAGGGGAAATQQGVSGLGESTLD